MEFYDTRVSFFSFGHVLLSHNFDRRVAKPMIDFVIRDCKME